MVSKTFIFGPKYLNKSRETQDGEELSTCLILTNSFGENIKSFLTKTPWREFTKNRTEIHQNLQAVEVVKLVKTRFSEYKWPLPPITRVYDSKPAMAALDWVPKWSFQRVLSEFESDSVQQGMY